MAELASRQDSSAVEPGNRYPNNDVLVQDGLAFLVGNSGDVNVAFLVRQELDDGGADLLPPHVGSQDEIEHTVSSLLGDGSVLVFGRGNDERTRPDVRALEEVWMLLGNARVVESLLEGRGRVWGVGKLGEGGHVARGRGWGGRRTRMEGCLGLQALDLEDREP